MEVAAIKVCPQSFPETQYIIPDKFALIPNKEHPEEKEKVCAVSLL